MNKYVRCSLLFGVSSLMLFSLGALGNSKINTAKANDNVINVVKNRHVHKHYHRINRNKAYRHFKLDHPSKNQRLMNYHQNVSKYYYHSAVNNYIHQHHLKPAKITHHIYRRFPKIPYRHGYNRPEGVVVHETADPHMSTHQEIVRMERDYNRAFVHSYVDDHHIINIASTKYLCYGVARPGNYRFVQFEETEVHSKKAFAEEVNNAAYYTAHLLKQYHLKPRDAEYNGKGTVWSHHAVSKFIHGTDHTDPDGYYRRSGKRWFGQPYSMKQLYQLILYYYYK